jgi:hypothetical protein
MSKTYLEFLVPTIEYFSTIKKHELAYEWVAPLILGIITYAFFNTITISTAIGSIESLLSILIGFSVAALAIITTSSSSNIEKLSEQKLVEKENI